jgi:hypothetical protein
MAAGRVMGQLLLDGQRGGYGLGHVVRSLSAWLVVMATDFRTVASTKM